MANMKTVKARTTHIGPPVQSGPRAGQRLVEWLVDGRWIKAGWVMPEVGPQPFSLHRRSV